MSDESINSPATFNNSFAPELSYIGKKTRVKFDGSCLKQGKITITHKKKNSKHIHFLWNKFVEPCRQ